MTDWLSSITARAGVDTAVVQRVHARYAIAPEPALPSPVPLHVTSVRFAGTKRVGGADEEFEFTWNLEPGIWAIVTDETNLRGKSTIIEIIRWALRGRSDLQADVRSWIRQVQVRILLNGAPHQILIDSDGRSVVGRIEVDGGAVLGTFASDQEFENVAENVMMSRLGLQALAFYQRDTNDMGSRRSQGWRALSDAMYIHSTDPLLGDVVMGGLAGRLLQVFLGLPWTSTLAAAKAAKYEIEERAARRTRTTATISPVLGRAREQLVARQVALASLPSIDVQMARRGLALASLASADETMLRAKDAHAVALAVLAAATETEREDERRLLDARETGALRRFFHGLDPKLCPRCDTTVARGRKAREAADGTCALCGEGVGAEDDGEALRALEQSLETLRAAREQAEEAEQRARASLEQAESELARAQAEAQAATATADDAERRATELEVARLAGVVEALETPVADDPSEDEADELHVINATVVVTDALQREGQEDLFAAANRAVLDLGRRFGIENLEAVRLNRAGQLSLDKGGATTSFSHLTGGEQLRLKVAVALGLLRVGHDLGVGRYPGLLLIDAPGGHETNDDDLRSMLQGLSETAAELPTLQVVVASARGRVVDALVPVDHERRPNEAGFLW